MTQSLENLSVHIYGAGPAAETVGAALGKLAAEVSYNPSSSSGGADLVVIPVVDPGNLASAPIGEMEEAEWIRRCEAPLAQVKNAFRHALTVLGKGGRIILLIPSIAMSGAEQLVTYSAVGEGARLMAKAVARAEGVNGITVNCLALSAELLNPGGTVAAANRFKPALDVPDMEAIAGFIATLQNGAPVMTGATIVLDGGRYLWV